MAVDDGIYREVDQELEEEKQLRQFKQAIPWLVGLALIVLVVVGARQWWTSTRQAEREENAAAFAAAQTAAEGEAQTGLSEYEAIAAEAPAGYAALASFRVAALRAQEGDTQGAIAALDDVIANNALPDRLRNLARLRAAYLSLEIGPDAAVAKLGGLQDEDSVLSAHAREIAGIAAMQREEYAQALSYFQGIDLIANAPPGLIQRGNEFAALARLGADGASLDEESMGQSLERLLDSAATTPAEGEADVADEAEPSPVDAEATPADEQGPPDQNDTPEEGTRAE